MAAGVDHPGTRPDPTGRRLAYLPAALLGNGSLLVTLSARGEIERMLWPHVDGPDNVRTLRLGVRRRGGVAWLDEPPAEWSQGWEGDVSVLRTTVTLPAGRIEILDAVDPDEPVLVRRVEGEPGVLVVSVEPMLEGAGHSAGAFVDPSSGIVVLHRRRAALAVAVDRPDVAADVGSVDGEGDDVAHVAPLWARLEGTYDGVSHVVAAFGATPFEALERARRQVRIAAEATARRRRADERLLARTAVVPGLGVDLDRLARRSVLVLEQLADRATGGIVAAPEMDEAFTESGGYGFVWPRDLAYVVLGLLAAGCGEAATAALRWLARSQAPEGLWLHRYWTTGEPAPSWGLHQVDETGVALVAAEAAFWELGDERLDRELWPVVRRAADFLVSFRDPTTGLPRASIDLWEQHDGQYAYSAASVVGGLRAAALAAGRHEPGLAPGYEQTASGVADAIDACLWDPVLGRYRRGVSIARPDGDGEPPGTPFERALPYPNRRVRSIDAVDTRLDSSLLGLAWPFAPLGVRSERVRATVDAVATGLAAPGGGLLRHEGDIYAGGHEWPLVGLWLGLARRALGDDEAYGRMLAHVVERRTPLDLLAEQVLPDGRPAWVVPLGWSHAMLLAAARPELRLVGRLREREGAGDGRGG
jgi:GH15 family glucan-1,4-alpha-glucosidase